MKAKLNKVTVAKIVGFACTVVGGLLTTYAGNQEAKQTIAELVKEEMNKN